MARGLARIVSSDIGPGRISESSESLGGIG
jgi:hypothetical protein